VVKTKQKTHKATAKRVEKSKSGKLLRKRAGARHLLAKKSAKRKRAAQKSVEISKADRQRVRRAMGV